MSVSDCFIIKEEIPTELFYELVHQSQAAAASDAAGEFIIASEGDEMSTEGEEGPDTSTEGSDLEKQDNYHQFAYMQHPNMQHNMLPNMMPNMLPSFRPDNTIVCPSAQFPDKFSPGGYQQIPFSWQGVGANATLNTDFGHLIKAIEEEAEAGNIPGEVSNVDVVN